MVSIVVSTSTRFLCPSSEKDGQSRSCTTADNARLGACVNVLKKVRTNGGWKLCPVVREANGRLRDRVRVNGRTEVHSESVYYLEWREAGRRLREAVPNRAEVLEPGATKIA
jgi:hypothetical protein